MTLVVGTNVSSLAAQKSLAASSRDMQTAMERLSSGRRINSASDDAAGLAIASRLQAQVNGMDMAVKNAIDGQAMVQSIESALNEVEDILQRMREISVQAANDTNTLDDRRYLNTEFQALSAELTRMASTAEFNGNKVLDGTLSNKLFQVGANGSDTISLTVGSVAATNLGSFSIDAGPEKVEATSSGNVVNSYVTGSVIITGNGVSETVTQVDDASAKTYAAKINTVTATTGVTATAITEVEIQLSTTSAAINLNIGSESGNVVNIGATTASRTNMTSLINEINNKSGSTGVTAKANAANDKIVLTDIDGDDIYLTRTDTVAGVDIVVDSLKSDGTSSGTTAELHEGAGTETDNVRALGRVKFTSSTAFSVTDPDEMYTGSTSKVDAGTAHVSAAKLDTQANATAAIATMDGAIESLASTRATLGSLDARLTHTASNLVNASAATNEALGKLRDADFSQESANLAKAQVLQQVGTAMLAQANAQPQLVLQLLQ
jgi:flagellin